MQLELRLTLCFSRIWPAQKEKNSEYPAAAPGIELNVFNNQGTVLRIPSMVIWSCTPLIAECSMPLSRLLKSLPNPTSPMTSKLKNMDQADMSIGLPTFLRSCVLNRSALALIRGSYVPRAACGQQSVTQQATLHTFNGKAFIPSPSSQTMIVKVARHVNRALLWVVAGLPVPSRFEALRIGSVQQRYSLLSKHTDLSWSYLTVSPWRFQLDPTSNSSPVRTKSPYWPCMFASSL
jgi:hypothetical protein